MLSILVVVTTSRAFAVAGFLEPYVGIGQTQVAIYTASRNDYDTKDIAFGFDLGFKGGVSFDKKFFAGLDYQTGGPFNFGNTMNQAEWSTQMIGIGVGIDYEIARFWGGYYPSETIHDGKNQLDYKGTAFKVGIGFKITKLISTNLDISFMTLKSSTDHGVDVTDTDHLPHVQAAFTSISIPVDF